MKLQENGSYSLEIAQRLLPLTSKEKELKVSEEEFISVLKEYNLNDSLIFFSKISAKLFDQTFEEDVFLKKQGNFIIHKPSKQLLTDFAIEYIVNILLISGADNSKKESVSQNDDAVALFSIYNNSLVVPIERGSSPASFLVPLFYQQISSQQDMKDAFVRQWLIFYQAQQLIPLEEKLDLDSALIQEIGLNVLDYTKLSFLILSYILTNPHFNFGTFANATIESLNGILNPVKISAFLKKIAATPAEILDLDKKYNSNLEEKYTKSRYNPLWEKPIVILGENDYLVPNLSAYKKGALRGLYWIFENSLGRKFREYFGKLFENYSGMLIKDIFGDMNVRPEISFKSKKEQKKFYDWVVNDNEEILLFECKAYQFPLQTLQTGNPELIKNSVFSRLVGTIKQMFERCDDIDKYPELEEFRGKKIVPIAVFYDIPLVSSSLYDADIKTELDRLNVEYPGISTFDYIFLTIEELENFAYIKDHISLSELALRVKSNPGSSISSEINEVAKENKISLGTHQNFLDTKFDEFCTQEICLPPESSV